MIPTALALADRRAHCQVDAVAVRADTLAGTALEHGADLNAGDACADNRIGVSLGHHLALRYDNLAGLRIYDIVNREAAEQTLSAAAR